MKGKRRRRGNPLADYRRIQSEIRAIFDPFTERHCPTCATPCCIKPTRCTPVDVALALATGHTFPHLGDIDPYEPALNHAGHRLGKEPGNQSEPPRPNNGEPESGPWETGRGADRSHIGDNGVAGSIAPTPLARRVALPMAQGEELEVCEYLHRGRCTFPNDLRPFGCTTYLCKPMYRHLPDTTIDKLRRLVRQLDEAHESLISALRDAGRMP